MSKNNDFTCEVSLIEWADGKKTNGYICKKYIEDFENSSSSTKQKTTASKPTQAPKKTEPIFVNVATKKPSEITYALTQAIKTHTAKITDAPTPTVALPNPSLVVNQAYTVWQQFTVNKSLIPASCSVLLYLTFSNLNNAP